MIFLLFHPSRGRENIFENSVLSVMKKIEVVFQSDKSRYSLSFCFIKVGLENDGGDEVQSYKCYVLRNGLSKFHELQIHNKQTELSDIVAFTSSLINYHI